MEILTSLLFGLVVLLGSIWHWLNRRQDYFKDLGIPYVPSTPLLGSFGDVILGKIGFYDQVVKLYNHPNVKDKPFFGVFIFHKPALMINDPELIKRILVKDFNSFVDRYSASDTHDYIGYYSLFASKGSLWKLFRTKLSPFFSSGKLKSMYYLLDKASTDMVDYIHKRHQSGKGVELDAKELATLYTTDVIASCAFGVEANSLENPEGEFRTAGRAIFNMKFWRGMEFTAFFMLPQVMKLFRFNGFSKPFTKFINTSLVQVIEEREKTGIKRNDLIDTIIELKKPEKEANGKTLTTNMLLAQAGQFYLAAFETSSTTQSFAMYELAKNSEIQEKLRTEIKEMLIRTEGKVTYDSIMNIVEMPYLHQVVHETIRLYAILPMLDRKCDVLEGYSLDPISNFTIPHGMPIYIPMYAIQRDAKNFPDPLKFDPERFSPENIGDIKPFTNFPFGSGPRSCIGERFGLMQVKAGLVKILKDFQIEATNKTPKQITLEKAAWVIQADVGLYLNLVKDSLHQNPEQ